MDCPLMALGSQSVTSPRAITNRLSTPCPSRGGEPVRLTDGSPSYWHGWSPDGQTIAFCGQRDGAFGIFTIPADGGAETRLTTAVHLDDGPEFSPDGEWIYFNSDRTGPHADLSDPTRRIGPRAGHGRRLRATGFRTSRPTVARWRTSPTTRQSPGIRPDKDVAAETDGSGDAGQSRLLDLDLRWPGHDQRSVVVSGQHHASRL